MDTEKIIRDSKVIMIVTVVIGVMLLAAGASFSFMNINIISNNRAIIGLSFIPFGVAFAYYFKIRSIKKSPQKMRSIIISESDERLISLRNEADAKAFKITQGALFLAYMGYTLLFPEDIFEAFGWWLMLIVMFVSFFAKAMMSMLIMSKEQSKNEEEK